MRKSLTTLLKQDEKSPLTPFRVFKGKVTVGRQYEQLTISS